MINSPSMTDTPRDLDSPEQISARPEIQSDAGLKTLPPQDGSDQSSTAGSQSPNVSDGMQVQGNTTVDQNPSVMDTILVRVKKAGRKVKHDGCGLFNETSWRWRVAVTFLALWGIVVPTYLTLRYNRPANDYALQSLKAAEWATYYDWLWTVCPAQEARNMSTPECEQAQSVTVPPLRRPYIEKKRQAIVDIFQRLYSDQSASQLLQADVDIASGFYTILDSPDWISLEVDESWNGSPSPDGNLYIHKHSIRALHAMMKAYAENYHSHLVAWFFFKLGIYIFIWSVLISSSCTILEHPRTFPRTRVIPSTLRRSVMLRLFWIGFLIWLATLIFATVVLNVKALATLFMKDRLLDSCLARKNSIGHPDCYPVQEILGKFVKVLRDRDIPMIDVIMVISAWRSHISTNIDLYDFTLIELNPLFVASLLFLAIFKFDRIRQCLEGLWHQRAWKLSRRILFIDKKQPDRSSQNFDEENAVEKYLHSVSRD